QLQVRDLEQCFFNCWVEGIDHHEMTLIFAPKPVRIVAEFGYQDQFDVYRKLKPVYQIPGAPENLEIVSAGPEHRMRRSERELALSWLTRHLKPAGLLRFDVDWSDYHSFLTELKQHQAQIDLKHHGLLSFCRKSIATRRPFWRGTAATIRQVPALKKAFQAKVRPLVDLQGKSIFRLQPGRYRLVFTPDYRIPVCICRGQGEKGLALLVDEKGLGSAWTQRQIEKLAAETAWLVAMEVFNTGQLRTSLKPCREGVFLQRHWRYYSPDIYHAADTFMLGSCPLALTMEEVLTLLVTLKSEKERLVFSGRGWPAVGLILLSSVLPAVKKCFAEKIPFSYQELFDSGYFWFDINLVIPGILKYTDLPVIISARTKTNFYLKNRLKPPERRKKTWRFLTSTFALRF
ncbi:MAG TPA: hypothetical protein PKX93_08375, partial [bacterium]|nr:hypothetical protein [bacterium]